MTIRVIGALLCSAAFALSTQTGAFAAEDQKKTPVVERATTVKSSKSNTSDRTTTVKGSKSNSSDRKGSLNSSRSN